jgi:integrase/recombinase XerD
VQHKQLMGSRFHTEAAILKAFCRTLGDIPLAEVAADRVQAYLAGRGPLTRFWHRKYEALLGFYRFVMARRYVLSCPLPKVLPRPPQPFVPYIFSPDELDRLLKASDQYQHPRYRLESQTVRTLLLLLYGAGLRISEALGLTVTDVDLGESLLTVRESKFYKTRLVPIGPCLTQTLQNYLATRGQPPAGASTEAPFLVSRTGGAITRHHAETAFRRLRDRAGVHRHDGARYQPRLHDLRHSFSVHRLVAWYREGADVNHLLPQLATYLGHLHVAATQRYLTMTPELLGQASLRFQRYALPEVKHE